MDQFLDHLMSEKSYGYVAPAFKTGEIKSKSSEFEKLDCTHLAGLIRLNYIAASELNEVSRQLSLSLSRIKE